MVEYKRWRVGEWLLQLPFSGPFHFKRERPAAMGVGGHNPRCACSSAGRCIVGSSSSMYVARFRTGRVKCCGFQAAGTAGKRAATRDVTSAALFCPCRARAKFVLCALNEHYPMCPVLALSANREATKHAIRHSPPFRRFVYVSTRFLLCVPRV